MAHKLTSIIAHYPNARNANDLLIDRIVASNDNRDNNDNSRQFFD